VNRADKIWLDAETAVRRPKAWGSGSRNVESACRRAPLQHVGVEAKLKNWASVFAVFRDPDYEVRGLSVAVGDDVAFGHCFGRLHGTLMNGTATKGIWVRVTFCFRKLDGAWQIVHDQASVPFDVLSGRGVADLEP
jgi:ketosteroid isomerase-like protein